MLVTEANQGSLRALMFDDVRKIDVKRIGNLLRVRRIKTILPGEKLRNRQRSHSAIGAGFFRTSTLSGDEEYSSGSSSR